MDHEIDVVSDGDGVAVIGDPTAVEAFLAPTGLESRDLGLPRLGDALAAGGAVAQGASVIAADSGRWVKLTKESAEALHAATPMTGSSPGVFRGLLTQNGKITHVLEFTKGPASVLANPAALAGAAGIMAQLAMQQTMDEITDYLATIDEKVDDILNCVTKAYADLWAQCWDDAFLEDEPILPRFDERPIGPEWTPDTPLRRAADRRNAQVEIDAMVAIMLGVPIEDLCTIYRTQLAVLYGYDHREYTYDANGRLVPNSVLSLWRKLGEPQDPSQIPESDRTAPHPGSGIPYTYTFPFATVDREVDLCRIATSLDDSKGR